MEYDYDYDDDDHHTRQQHAQGDRATADLYAAADYYE
jgi:hypothetical protein